MSHVSTLESLEAGLLAAQVSLIGQRREGVAFLKVAKDLYRLLSISYVCINIPSPAPRKHFVHCLYSDTCVKQFISGERVRINLAD
jgi:hypothetical protein